jgi:DNA repair protein RecO (recombination protein O)
MQWTDEGIIIGTRRHGETSLIVELMTRAHGRHLGLVRGGRSRKQQPVLQPGNTVTATWRARLDEHLGNYAMEPTVSRAARLIEGPAGLYGMQIVAGLLRLLPERDPHPALFDGIGPMLDWLDDPLVGGALIVRFELKMLEDLGFGLDLDECGATGATADLIYVSPKTGRAVCRSAGEAYRDRLLPLPAFLVEAGLSPGAGEIADAFRLTGYFLARRVFEPRAIALPEARGRFLALVARSLTVAAEAAE